MRQDKQFTTLESRYGVASIGSALVCFSAAGWSLDDDQRFITTKQRGYVLIFHSVRLVIEGLPEATRITLMRGSSEV
jgi:hypothetical protein